MIDTIQRSLMTEGIIQVRTQLKELGKKQKRKNVRVVLEAVDEILLNILSLNQAPSTSLEIKNYHLRELLTNISQMYAPFFRKKQIDFSIGAAALQIAVDRTLFDRIFFNMIYYMARHMDMESENSRFIRVEASAYNEELVAIYVEDNGCYPSLDKSQIEGKTYEKKVCNVMAGIGLGAVKEWLTALKGSFQVVDKLGPGIKCCLLIPQRLPKQTRGAFAPRLHSKYKIFKGV